MSHLTRSLASWANLARVCGVCVAVAALALAWHAYVRWQDWRWQRATWGYQPWEWMP